MRLQIFGGGKMGEALLAGLIAAGWAPAEDLAVVEKFEARRAELTKLFPGVAVLADASPSCADAVVAVKPPDVEAACRALAAAGVGRAVSIAAGIPLAKLEAWLGADVRVVRAMPNTPAQVGAGAAAIAGGTKAGPDDLDWAEGVVAAVGVVVRLPEPLLDAVTGLSASGPAYVYLVAEAMTDAGVAAGIPREASARLAVQTLLGASRLLVESGQSPEALRAAVTTPGGTTAAGLRVLENRAVRAAFIEAVLAATERARELGT